MNEKNEKQKIKPNTDQNTTIPNHNSLKLSCLNDAYGFLFHFCFLLSFSFSSPDRSLSFSTSILSFFFFLSSSFSSFSLNLGA